MKPTFRLKSLEKMKSENFGIKRFLRIHHKYNKKRLFSFTIY